MEGRRRFQGRYPSSDRHGHHFAVGASGPAPCRPCAIAALSPPAVDHPALLPTLPRRPIGAGPCRSTSRRPDSSSQAIHLPSRETDRMSRLHGSRGTNRLALSVWRVPAIGRIHRVLPLRHVIVVDQKLCHPEKSRSDAWSSSTSGAAAPAHPCRPRASSTRSPINPGAPQVTQLRPVLRGELNELGVVRDELVQPALEVEPGCEAVLEQIAPRRRKAPALRRDTDERGRRPEGQCFGDGRDDRESL